MNVFTDRELRLIQKLRDRPSQSILQIRESCLHHSLCFPLPQFRVYKRDDETFEAQWNDPHQTGTTQVFQFADVLV